MDAVYDGLSWSSWRPKKVSWDQRGIDVVLKTSGTVDTLWADEKAATQYWNCPIIKSSGYACELTCETNYKGRGWFSEASNQYLETNAYVFIQVHSLEPELIHISELKLRVVKKDDLQKLFRLSCGLTREDPEAIYGFLEKVQFDGQGFCPINEFLRIKKTKKFPEQSIIAIFDGDILDKIAIHSIHLQRMEIRDMLRNWKEKTRL